MDCVNIIGAGLAGLSAAMTLAKRNIRCRLVSVQSSERAQSVLAEGGINGALDTMGESDDVRFHMEDTLKAGVYLADPEAVRGLAEHAPEVIRMLRDLGVPFNTLENGEIRLRNFGGQKKKRTAYAKSSTGKIIMSAMIDAVRRYEAESRILRMPHHEFLKLALASSAAGTGERICSGAVVRDVWTGEVEVLPGPVILAVGGMNGMFPGMTTGTTANSGDAVAAVFRQGVRLGNMEMIQYHPTTFGIADKRCLVTEAARGEGGRLFIERNGGRWYFMEEKYPEQGNLASRDVISRQMYFVMHDPSCGGQVYLDLTELGKEIWQQRLPDLRKELIHYLALDPAKSPIPVEPGIHYFMGGIEVDVGHQTNIRGLLAAGECCCQYHGANRLGGNSMLGALYGGRVAADSVAEQVMEGIREETAGSEKVGSMNEELRGEEKGNAGEISPELVRQIAVILGDSLGIVRKGEALEEARISLEKLLPQCNNERERNRVYLAQAMVISAELRRESRGAHYRSDYPETEAAMARQTWAEWTSEGVMVQFRQN